MSGDSYPADGITQARPRPGIIDLGPGYLDAALIPGQMIRQWAAMAIERWGAAALAYGADGGPGVLRTCLAEWTAGPADRSCGAGNVLVTGGTSAALDRLAAGMARAGTTVLTESLTYDLGKQIFLGRGVTTIEVPGPGDDLDLAEVRKAAIAAIRETGKPPALYLIPTFHNPTGRVLSVARRRDILAMSADLGMTVIEDQAYADLSYDSPPPPPLWQLAERPELVISLYSLAKCLAPGLRLGWLVSSDTVVAELAASGERRSGGGPNHFAATVLAAGCLSGQLEPHVSELKRELRRRRDYLLAALSGQLPQGFCVHRPAGGFFVWVTLPGAVDDRELLARAESRGVSFAPGHRFGSAVRGIRLCLAAAAPPRLYVGVRALAAAAREAIGG